MAENAKKNITRMVDIVYLTSNNRSNKYQHEELRYSLRSLEKHVSGIGDVYMIGVKPEWVQNINFIREYDVYKKNKDANIILKVHVACVTPQISSPFLFVNDDHFFTRDIEASKFPNYHKGDAWLNSKNPKYRQRMTNTRTGLVKKGLLLRNYDIHTPILIDKQRFIEIFRLWGWSSESPGIVMKSVYANSAGLLGIEIEDCKLTADEKRSVEELVEMVGLRPCFSTDDLINNTVWALLKRLYPEKAKWER
jgi:hypothetical protein